MARLSFLLLTLGLLGFGPAARAAEDQAVCVVSTKVNQAFLEELKGDLRKGVAGWLAAAAELSLPARVVGEYELANPIVGCRVLVLHLSYRLSDGQVDTIERYFADGGSLLLVGEPGKYSETGGFREESLTDRQLGLGAPKPFNPKELKTSFIQFSASNPVALALEPGLRLELDWSQTYWMAEVQNPGAFITDWAMNPITDKDPSKAALMAFRETDRGRLAWMGFPPEAILGGEKPSQGPVVARQVLAWTAGIPMAAKAWWPQGAQASAIIGTDLVGDPVDTQLLAGAYIKEGLKGSFFLPATPSPELATTIASLASAGSVGTSGINQASFKDLPLEAQQAEMAQARKNLAAAGLANPAGLRLPMEEWDANTAKAALAEGFEFLYGNNSYDRCWPLRHQDGEKTLWHFGRIIPDYYGVGPDAKEEDFVKGFGAEATRLMRLGCPLALNLDAAMLGDKESPGLASALLRWLRAQKVKLLSFQEAVDWLKLRDTIKLTVAPGRASMELTVANPTGAFVKAFPVIYAPPVPKKPELIRSPGGVTVGEPSGPGFVLLVDLAPFETKKLLVR